MGMEIVDSLLTWVFLIVLSGGPVNASKKDSYSYLCVIQLVL